jgi:RluA family pseudouridine synthase
MQRLLSFRLSVAAAAAGERLDMFLARHLSGASRKKIKKALDEGRIQINGMPVRRAGLLLSGGEQLSGTVEANPQAPAWTLDILYQDACLLAVNKPAGLPSHRTSGDGPNAQDLAADMLDRTDNPPILLHRLDQDTSGVLLLALTGAANRELARQFSAREVEKTYLALVAGNPPDQFEISNHLKAKSRGRTIAVHSGGQPAQTLFTTLSRHHDIALVEARPRTGRTHQIRAHLAGEGYHLLGDELYGGPGFVEIEGQTVAISRHLLHAWKLRITHPTEDSTLTIEAPLPEDFKGFISDRWSVL